MGPKSGPRGKQGRSKPSALTGWTDPGTETAESKGRGEKLSLEAGSHDRAGSPTVGLPWAGRTGLMAGQNQRVARMLLNLPFLFLDNQKNQHQSTTPTEGAERLQDLMYIFPKFMVLEKLM